MLLLVLLWILVAVGCYWILPAAGWLLLLLSVAAAEAVASVASVAAKWDLMLTLLLADVIVVVADVTMSAITSVGDSGGNLVM